MTYALVNNVNDILRLTDDELLPPPLAAAKGLKWLPVVNIRPEPATDEMLDGPSITVQADKVIRAWTARPKTLAERLSDVQAARRAAYPPIGEQLDAAFKARAGNPSAIVAIDAAIAAVKAAHPKPAA